MVRCFGRGNVGGSARPTGGGKEYQWFCHMVCPSYLSGFGGDNRTIFWNFSNVSGRNTPLFAHFYHYSVCGALFQGTFAADQQDGIPGGGIAVFIYGELWG